MPASKKRKTSSKYTTDAVYQVAKLLDKQARVARAKRNYVDIGGLLNAQALGPYLKEDQTPYTLDESIGYLAARGRGGYNLRAAARGAGGAVAKRLGVSRRVGRNIGGLAYGLGKSYLGGGGYVPVGRGEYSGPDGGPSNSLVGGSDVTVPTMQGGDEIGSVTIQHREFLGNITGSIGFDVSAFHLNPGLVSSFPWLSQIAVNYEEYEFQQLMYTYTSLLSEATASGSVGSVIMSTNYNAGQPEFSSSNDMMNNIGTVSARPTENRVIHGIECNPQKNVMGSYYVRVGSVPSGQDVKTYDMGVFQLATEGMPTDDQLQGQLWVSYNIVLRKPKLFTAAGKGILQDSYKGFDGFQLTKPLGSVLYASPSNTIGTSVAGSYDPALLRIHIHIQFPSTVVQGNFMVEVMWTNLTYNGSTAHSSPQMIPTSSASNAVYVPEGNNAVFGNDTNITVQQAAYSTSLAHTGFRYIFKLGGNYAVDTFVHFTYQLFQAGWFADDVQVVITQVNPTFTASTAFDVDPTWIPIAQ